MKRDIAMGVLAASAFVLGAAAPAGAQQMLTDPSPYRRPAIFVPPDPPHEALQAHGELAYAVVVDIDAKGQVSRIASLEPDDSEFRRRLDAVAKFWLFYPQVDPDRCIPVASQGRIDFQYRQGERRPKAWLKLDPMGSLLQAPPPRGRAMAPLPQYPDEEALKGIQGDVFMLVRVGQDGVPADAELLLGLPASPGFVRVAREHAVASRWDAGTALQRCVAVHYRFVLK